jgi:type I restriction enzyme S subunit
VHPAYLRHWLSTETFQATKDRLCTGATQKAITNEKLSLLTIPLPARIEDQIRIAEILDKAEALRAKRRASLAQLDALPQHIFLDMFGDPIANPLKWPWKKLTDLGTVERGVSKHRPRNAPELLGGPYPFVQTGDVANCDGYIRTFSATYSEAGLRQSKMWPAGTLCITIAANIAKTGILTFNACFPDSVVGFRAGDSATIQFVRTWLSFLQASLEAQAPESAQKNINLEILRALDVPDPGAEMRSRFAQRVATVEALKASERRAQCQLENLCASLRHRAFGGTL